MRAYAARNHGVSFLLAVSGGIFRQGISVIVFPNNFFTVWKQASDFEHPG